MENTQNTETEKVLREYTLAELDEMLLSEFGNNKKTKGE